MLTNPLAADESLKFWKIFEKKAGATAGIGASSATELGCPACPSARGMKVLLHAETNETEWS
ncbi:hypothetical protein Lal_00003738 [Lupinus albus]|nr:hypothetical protein Lal_00003738 [Lupinus albus]